MTEDQITIGEVYRICVETKALVKEQNGRVRKLEEDSIRVKTIGALAVFAWVPLWDWIKHRVGL